MKTATCRLGRGRIALGRNPTFHGRCLRRFQNRICGVGFQPRRVAQSHKRRGGLYPTYRGNVIAELNATGSTVREYLYLPESEIVPTRQSRTQVDRPIAVVDAVNTATPVTLYVHVDQLNRPARLLAYRQAPTKKGHLGKRRASG